MQHRNWNNAVGQDDIVFHLGDFSLGGSAEWTKMLDRLNGKIYLIVGNHDLKNLRQGYANRFESVAMQMWIEVEKQKIYLNHYPFLCFDGGYKDVWQLFGHVHTRKNNTGIDAARLQYLYPTQYDVGVDNNDFTPVSFEHVKRIINPNRSLDRQLTSPMAKTLSVRLFWCPICRLSSCIVST